MTTVSSEASESVAFECALVQLAVVAVVMTAKIVVGIPQSQELRSVLEGRHGGEKAENDGNHDNEGSRRWRTEN